MSCGELSEDPNEDLDEEPERPIVASEAATAPNVVEGALGVAHHRRSSDAMSFEEVAARYADLAGEVLLVRLETTGSAGSCGSAALGLSIAGNKNRNLMSVFICGVHPNGVAHQEGTLHIGDEILEVNGAVIFGRSHLNASAIIKSFPGPVYKIAVLRRADAVNDMAVQPLTQYPLYLDNQVDYSSYKDIKNVVVRKGSCRLGLMIIEGTHADAGHGIFISDVQEGSPAQQAGLAMGDMILSVNHTDLVGADYEKAVQVLKANDGTVQMTIAKPSRSNNLSAIQRIPSRTERDSVSHQQQHQQHHSSGAGGRVRDIGRRGLTGSGCASCGSGGPFGKRSMVSANCPSPTAAEIPHSPSQNALLFTPAARTGAARPAISETIVAGEETIIEIARDKMGMGLSVVGGADTPLGAVVVHEVLEHGAAYQDGRLKVGDQIVELNGIDLCNASHEQAINALRQVNSPVRMVVYRDTEQNLNANNETFEVKISKKPGRGLGVCIMTRNRPPGGVFISEVVPGGAVEQDGRLFLGDEILEINGENVKHATPEHAAAIIKLANGNVSLKIGRLKPSKNI